MKEMKLYEGVNRIYRELEAVGIRPGQPLRVSDLTPFDQYHYHGTAAVDEAINRAGISSGMRVLDIGSGIGGPARYIAEQTGAHVTALELQADLSETGADLTMRCGLSNQVRHLNGNVLNGVTGTFDVIISMLCFLHIEDRQRLFTNCRAALRPGGTLYIEDYGMQRKPSGTEKEALARKVQCPFLPSSNTYQDHLQQAAFHDVEVIDVTEDWTNFTAARLEAYRNAKSRHIALHGEGVVSGLEDFYATVAQLFADGVLKGLKITAR